MIPLPPGCTVNFPVRIDIVPLTEEVIEWYKAIGGTVFYDKFFDSRGREITQPYVSYGKGKRCHYHHNGEKNAVRLHFNGEDASVASMFILKFMDLITAHNLEEVMARRELEL
jgi:hypothetical protein